MDLRMPGVDGVDRDRARSRSEWPERAILVLTTYDTDEAIVRAIDAGATGYLLKDAPRDDTARRRPPSRRRTDRALAAGRTATRRPRPQPSTQVPSPQREIEVLREVAAATPTPRLADRLHISQATVKTHLLHIYAKLGVADRAAAVAHAYDSNILTPRNS